MPQFSEKILKWIFIALFLSLTGATLKGNFFGVPLYLPEILTVLALCFSLVLLYKKPFTKEVWLPDSLVIFGALCFFFGALFSFLVNPFSLTGLGMIKAWFFFPLLSAWLLFLSRGIWKERETLFLVWLCMCLGVALLALLTLLKNDLTCDGRLQAFFTSPNFLALTVAPGILMTLYFLLDNRRLEKYFYTKKVFLIIALLVLCSVVFFTRSYAVWSALFLASLFFFWKTFPLKEQSKKLFFFCTLLLVFVGVFVFLEYGSDKWNSLVHFDERSSLASRLMIWDASKKMIVDRPFFGIGVGRFQEVYLAYQKFFPPYLEWAVPQPHSLYLALLLQTGLLGFLGFCLLVGKVWQLLIEQLRKNREEKNVKKVALMLSLLSLYLVYGLLDTPYFKTDLAFIFCLLLALCLSIVDDAKKTSHE